MFGVDWSPKNTHLNRLLRLSNTQTEDPDFAHYCSDRLEELKLEFGVKAFRVSQMLQAEMQQKQQQQQQQSKLLLPFVYILLMMSEKRVRARQRKH